MPSFKLNVAGHGFGLDGVTYHVGQSLGVTEAPRALRVEIRKRDGTIPAEINRASLKIVSPTALIVTVDLGSMLPADTYDLLLFGDGAEAIAEKRPAFEVTSVSDGPILDATPPRDAAARPDAAGDAGALDAEPDAGGGDPRDAGFLDATARADSGLGPFPTAARFRRPITLINDTGLASPVDVTVRIPVPHAQMLAAGESSMSGVDLAVYLGAIELPYWIEDRALVGTDRLELIVRLPVAIAPGVTSNLALYSDPMLAATTPPTEAVYLFVERFDADFPAFTPGNRGQWNDRWLLDCEDRLRPQQPQSRCTSDDTALVRRSVASPAILGMSSTPAANEIYEVVAFLRGSMQSPNDLLYFAIGPDNEAWDRTTTLPDGAYDPAFAPNAQLSFTEIDNRTRTERGYRFPPPPGQAFARMRARLVPATANAHLHFRFVSADQAVNPASVVSLDDLSVRRALNPDFRVSLGPVEPR